MRGEGQQAYDCMANGTKAVGVIGVTTAVTLATGGLGTGAALAVVGGAAASTQVGLDGVDTAIRSAAAGELVAVGTIQSTKKAIETGDAVHIAEAIIAPCQTAALAAGSAAIARSAAAGRAAAAQNENIAGTGQSMEAPAPGANTQLNADSLARLPDGPRPGMLETPAPPQPTPGAPSVAPSASPSAIESLAASGSVSGGSVAASQVSLVSDAYSQQMQARILSDNPVTFLDERGTPTKRVQHAWGNHRAQYMMPEGFPINWNTQVGLRFVNWLRDSIEASTMYDVTYRGVTGHRLLFNPRTNLGVVVWVARAGRMDLVAAFPLSPAQFRHVMSQGGRVN